MKKTTIRRTHVRKTKGGPTQVRAHRMKSRFSRSSRNQQLVTSGNAKMIERLPGVGDDIRILVYDGGPETSDRYTVIDVTDGPREYPGGGVLDPGGNGPFYDGLALGDVGPEDGSSLNFSQGTSVVIGDHLGKRIKFSDLPKNTQNHAIMRYREALQ